MPTTLARLTATAVAAAMAAAGVALTATPASADSGFDMNFKLFGSAGRLVKDASGAICDISDIRNPVDEIRGVPLDEYVCATEHLGAVAMEALNDTTDKVDDLTE
ncbi:hypothetical protein SMC26_13895 [Actinomadura fulvescens]|uniref:Uncharacterized protein n=1 Tax=Actinomadura fulvescens TaxID=46160 RepID=A0ABP6CJA9_9ACTN